MAYAVRTVAVVEELVISPPDNKASPPSAAAGESLRVDLATLKLVLFSTGESLMVDLATLKLVPFSIGKTLTGVQATWFR